MDVERVKLLLKDGLTYKQIGELHGTTRNSVATFVRRKLRGVPHRYEGTYKEWQKGIPSKCHRTPSRQKPSMPYVPGVTEDGKRYVDIDEEKEKARPRPPNPSHGEHRDQEARAR